MDFITFRKDEFVSICSVCLQGGFEGYGGRWEGCEGKSGGKCGHYSSTEVQIAHRYFGDRDFVRIPVMKLVLNGCHGGFCLSEEAKSILREKQASGDYLLIDPDTDVRIRCDPALISTIDQIGCRRASG